jgi:hypothetical protein
MTKFDAFSNAMVQMEEMFPRSTQTPLPVGKLPDDAEVQLANIFGFAGTLFFTIPDNPALRTLGETVDDRLFKIRHSQDINGIFRKLPLFEPPIDPALLVQATAQGLSLSSVLTDLNGSMPNYRFRILLQRALELAAEVKQFGQSLLAAREKQDSEAYAVLRAKHETSSQAMVMEMKKLALEEAQRSLEALEYTRKAPESRMRFFLRSAGEELAAIPGAAAEFQELNEKLQAPIEEGGLKLLPSEKEEMSLNASAASLTMVVNALESLAGGFHALPIVASHATPLGCGAAFQWGPPNIGHFTSAIARGISASSSDLIYRASAAGQKATALRSLNDRLQQVNAAGYEISSIDKQITASKIRVAIASKDISVQQQAIDQSQEAYDFLRQKYSNTELYSWISGQTKTLFYNTYTQAYDLAKKVEKVFKFERPQVANTTFIQPGYWNASKDGLLAGEGLYYALKQLEAAYMDNIGYDYEISKMVSLRQINPMALMYLRETGSCEFSIPEIYFDMDFPGHYLRRIKSVAVTVPCVVSPYTSVNATLRLMSNKFRTKTSLADGYAERPSPGAATDDRFATTNVPISAIAVSSGQQDPGVFELNFSGDRYLPFGAASTWRLELPPDSFRPFDYRTIADVVLQIRYTSVEGGSQLRSEAEKAVKGFLNNVESASGAGGLFALFDIKNEFAAQWTRFVHSSGAGIELPELQDKLPSLPSAGPRGVLSPRRFTWSATES